MVPYERIKVLTAEEALTRKKEARLDFLTTLDCADYDVSRIEGHIESWYSIVD